MMLDTLAADGVSTHRLGALQSPVTGAEISLSKGRMFLVKLVGGVGGP